MSTNLVKYPNYLSRLVYYLKSFILLFRNIDNFLFILPKLLLKKETKIRTKEGFLFFCRDLMELWTIKETILEDVYRIKEYLKIKDIKTVIDIGGAFGDFDIYMQKLAPSSKCYVFEPQTISCKQMKKNLELNDVDLSKVIISNTAVSNSEDEAIFKKNVSTNGLANGEMVFLESEEGTVEINFSNLNYFLNKFDDDIDILKIDCEGGEYNILPSLEDKHLKRIKFITMEWHEFSKGQSHKELETLLKEKNFSVIAINSPVHNEIGYLFAKNNIT